MLLDHAGSDRVLDLGPVADVGDVLAGQEAAAAVTAARRCGATWCRSSTPPAPTRASSWGRARAPG